ncbi:MAG: ABC transporter permease [Geminicoccaceae bacterium]
MLLVTAAVLLLVLGLSCLAAPLVAAWLGHGADEVNLLNRLAAPSWTHPLGTDELGRDVLVRLLYGGRVSLAVGLCGALTASLIGTAIGLCAGYVGGQIDAWLMRVTDLVIALPLLPLLIVLAALDFGKLGLPGLSSDSGIVRIVIIVALFGWTTVARLVRGEVLRVKQMEYIRASLALGGGHVRIMARHILPNLAGLVVVASALAVGSTILAESVLSFLGLGIQPPQPSWGNMLSGAQELMWRAPRLAIAPGVLIFVSVLAVNLLGDQLQAHWLRQR